MFSKVGDDIYGKQALQVLENSGVDIRHVETCQGVNTGIAVIHVNKEGENYIVIEGANKHVDIDYIKRSSRSWIHAAWCCCSWRSRWKP